MSKNRRRLAWLAAGGLTLSMLLGPAIGSVFAASVTPSAHDGNITECPLEGYLSIFIDGNDSSGSKGGVTVDVTYHDNNSLDFTATGGLVYVAYVKGGDKYNTYDYRPGGVASDTNLVSPDNVGGQVPKVSHSVYCVKETTETTTTTSSESSATTTTSSESSATTTTSSESSATTTTSSESSATTTTTSGQELPATGSPKATLPSTSTDDPTDGGPSNGTIALVLILLGAGAAGLVVLSPSSIRIRK